MAAVVDILKEVNPKIVSENRLQPLSSQSVPRSTDQIDQVLAEAQDVCRIKGRFIVARRAPA